MSTANTPQRASTSSQRSNPAQSQSQPSSTSSAKARQYAHLNAQLAQLSANMADFDNIMKMTAVQARAMRELGGYAGAMYDLFPSLDGRGLILARTADKSA